MFDLSLLDEETQSGSEIDLFVGANQEFGFRVLTKDNLFGEGVLTVLMLGGASSGGEVVP